MKNRSVPTDAILPHVLYQNVPDAIAWLSNAFGFTEHYRYGDPPGRVGAQMHLGDAWIMLETVRPGGSTPARLGYGTQYLTIFVDNVDAHFHKAKTKGVIIVEDLNETVYGERQYVARDPEGHHWLFSQHIADLSPQDWGAKIANT